MSNKRPLPGADLDQVKIVNSQGKNFKYLPKSGNIFVTKSEQIREISEFSQGLLNPPLGFEKNNKVDVFFTSGFFDISFSIVKRSS